MLNFVELIKTNGTVSFLNRMSQICGEIIKEKVEACFLLT